MTSFTVITPVYCVDKEYLKHCVQSVLQQSYGEIQLILVDDGSPDDCGNLCDEFARFDCRIEVIHKENGGTASARNAGLIYAKGDWITFLDADDWLEQDAFSRLLPFCETEQTTDIILFSGMRDYTGVVERVPLHYKNLEQFSTQKEREDLQLRILAIAADQHPASIGLVSTCAKLYRREFLIKEGVLFDSIIKYNEDGLFNLEAFEKAKSILNAKESLYHYRCSPDSKVHQYRPSIDDEQTLLIERITNFAEQYRKGDRFLHAIDLRCIISMQLCLCQKFYHPSFSCGNRHRAFKAFLDRHPFRDALKHVHSRELTPHFMLKYLCIKWGLYGMMYYMHNCYFKLFQKN